MYGVRTCKQDFGLLGTHFVCRRILAHQPEEGIPGSPLQSFIVSDLRALERVGKIEKVEENGGLVGGDGQSGFGKAIRP